MQWEVNVLKSFKKYFEMLEIIQIFDKYYELFQKMNQKWLQN